MGVITYKCPQCGAPLEFNSDRQLWQCEFCQTEVEEKDVKVSFTESREERKAYDEEFNEGTVVYTCPSCGANIIADKTTAATFCVFCNNSTIIPGQLSGNYRPAKVIPFKKSRDDAVKTFVDICRKRPLLPKDFYSQRQIEKIRGIYIPFWLFECGVEGDMSASARKINTWSDSKYIYTKTSHFSVYRKCRMKFENIPADGSSKMDDSMMDAIEPYDFNESIDFSMTYLSGYLAEKYDLSAEDVFQRVYNRVSQSVAYQLRNTIKGYSSVSENNRNLNFLNVDNQYVLLPVWLLISKYKEKQYIFAMNGQTGKLVGKLPISVKKALLWFGGVSAGLFLILCLLGALFI